MKIEYLRSILSYNPDTGEFRWLIDKRRVKKGNIAGYINHEGYRIIRIDGKAYIASRLAYFYMTGEWPIATMDHDNRNRSDDKWTNINPATMTQQAANKNPFTRNAKGSIIRKGWRWQAYYRGRYLGSFILEEDAKIALETAKELWKSDNTT